MNRIQKITQNTHNRFLNYFTLDAVTKSGKKKEYYMASRAEQTDRLKMNTGKNTPDGVTIYALYGEKRDQVILVRQYRYPMGEVVLELPAGKLEKGEDPSDSGLRELAEETGLEPKTYIPMGVSFSSPGIMTEKIYYFFATDLVQGPVHPDDGEFLDVVRLPLEELEELAKQGEIKDAKTLIGLFKAKMLMRERESRK